jgi:hypothetical protein
MSLSNIEMNVFTFSFFDKTKLVLSFKLTRVLVLIQKSLTNDFNERLNASIPISKYGYI